MAGKYDDIIGLPHHQSPTRPHMSLNDRAAQFSPFAALTGHEEAIREAGRLTDEFREPDESVRAVLDDKLRMLCDIRERKPEVSIDHFLRDDRKDGGAYLVTAGRFVKLDGQERCVVLDTGERIPLECIRDIGSPIFDREPADETALPKM